MHFVCTHLWHLSHKIPLSLHPTSESHIPQASSDNDLSWERGGGWWVFLFLGILKQFKKYILYIYLKGKNCVIKSNKIELSSAKIS